MTDTVAAQPDMHQVLPGWVQLADVAAAARLNPASLRERISRGTLPARKVGTVWVVDLVTARAVVAARR